MARTITPVVLGALAGALALTPVPAGAGPAPTSAPSGQPVVTVALTSATGAALQAPAPAPTHSRTGASTFAQDAAADAVVVRTEPLAAQEASVAALTWSGELPAGTEILLRDHDGEQWAPWSELDTESGAPEAAVPGTEPYVAAGASEVQVMVVGERAPADLELHLIPADPAPAATAAAGEPAASAAAAPMTTGAAADGATIDAARPAVTTRQGWGANEALMDWTPDHRPLRAAVIHHTAGRNDYGPADSAGIVRGIYYYHAVTRDWGDIGYNILVDKYGQIFEGRAGTLAAAPGRMPEAAHARSFNSGTLGISLLGDYSAIRAPQLALDTMAEVIAWQFAEADLTAADPSGYTSPGTAARPAGQALPRIFAHRDVGATTCPGDDIYSRIPGLITQVDTLADVPVADVVEYHLKNSLVGGPADLALRLGRPEDGVLVGDWDGDGIDTLALRRGNEYHVYNEFRGGPADRVVRYGRADDVVLVGDWDGDGRDTLAVRRGREYHVKNEIASGSADVLLRYGRPDDVVLVGDWDADGSDTLTVRRGHEYHVRNVMVGGDADVVLHYGRPDDVVLVGDWDADGSDTLAVRRGNEYHVRNAMAGGPADTTFRYGRADDVVLVGDWDGDGYDTLGVRRD